MERTLLFKLIKMEENKRREWMNLAQTHCGLRFPSASLQVISPFNMQGRGRINIETFISNLDGSRITLFRQSYETIKEGDIFEFLDHLKERFRKEALMVKRDYIFNEDTSIAEPFEINKK